MNALRPTERSVIRIQPDEINEAAWLPVDEFYKIGSKFSKTFLDMYFNAIKYDQLITPNHFKMKYQQYDRHMIMYHM